MFNNGSQNFLHRRNEMSVKIPLMNIHKGKQERVAFFSKGIEKIKRFKKKLRLLGFWKKAN